MTASAISTLKHRLPRRDISFSCSAPAGWNSNVDGIHRTEAVALDSTNAPSSTRQNAARSCVCRGMMPGEYPHSETANSFVVTVAMVRPQQLVQQSVRVIPG